MKLSYQWLKNYVNLPEDLSMEQLAYDLTMRTVEVEGTEDLSQRYEHIVAGKILSIAPHPNADRLSVCQVDVGDGEAKQIVCGGSNLVEGHYVVCTLPGAKAVWHGEGDAVTIEAAELRGVSSYGMIAGANEIGLSDLFPAQDEHAIVDLDEAGISSEVHLHPGMPLVKILGLDDQILEIENKSITNRPDLWGHYGVARELAAIYGVALAPRPTVEIGEEPQANVSIAAPERCRRFVGALYEGVSAKKSPLWLRVALSKVDIRPINALVDITNYAMMAYGEPTHAYDADHLQGGIRARLAREGETLEILDGHALTLTADDLVIADDEKALGLAGIMGGKQDSILPETTRILLEAANFDPAAVRRTAQRYSLRTEASTRHEKGLDQARVEDAFACMDQLLHALYPDAQRVSYSDIHTEEPVPVSVNVSTGWLTRRLGREVDLEQVRERLEPLGFAIERLGEEDGVLLRVKVPSWRATGDVSRPDDILEEMARMIGYENFDVQIPQVALNGPVHQRKEQLDRRIMEYLAFSCGYQEITSYPWVRDEALSIIEAPAETLLRLDQPPAPDQGVLRPSHVPNVIDAITKNVRFFDAFDLFEQGEVYTKGEMSPSSPDEVLPAMRMELVGASVSDDPAALFYKVKGVLEEMGAAVQTEALHFTQTQKPAWADPNGWLNICQGDRVIGAMGLLSMRAKKTAGLKFVDACLFELKLEEMAPFDSRSNQYRALPQFPHVFQDLSLLVDASKSFVSLKEAIGTLAESVAFVDEYRGKQIPEGKKSITLRVELAKEDGTLTGKEIDRQMAYIREALKDHGASVRDA